MHAGDGSRLAIQWRNKPHTHQPHTLKKGWHHYDTVSEQTAKDFMAIQAPNHPYFEFRVVEQAEYPLPLAHVQPVPTSETLREDKVDTSPSSPA